MCTSVWAKRKWISKRNYKEVNYKSGLRKWTWVTKEKRSQGFFWAKGGFSGKTQINNIECENTREKGKNKQYAFWNAKRAAHTHSEKSRARSVFHTFRKDASQDSCSCIFISTPTHPWDTSPSVYLVTCHQLSAKIIYLVVFIL